MPSLKRKRGGDTAENIPGKDANATNAMDIFRRHFESQFGSVKRLGASVKPSQRDNSKGEEEHGSESDSNSDRESNGHEAWGGLGNGTSEVDDMRSDEEEEEDDEEGSDGSDDEKAVVTKAHPRRPVEVVEYDYSKPRSSALSQPLVRASRREFMSSKPPRPTTTPIPPKKTSGKGTKAKGDSDDSNDDAENLRNDVILQRLISESHLLDGATLSHASGKNRQAATEMRIQTLGGEAISKLDKSASKVPMNIRKGIAAKSDDKEKKRRQMAKEAGIVLEAAKKKKAGKGAGGAGGGGVFRVRGVGVPSVGKFKGGALVLSKKDLAGLTGGDKKKGGKGKRKGKRK